MKIADNALCVAGFETSLDSISFSGGVWVLSGGRRAHLAQIRYAGRAGYGSAFQPVLPIHNATSPRPWEAPAPSGDWGYRLNKHLF